MANGIVDGDALADIADAIRIKNGSSDTYLPSEMAQAIEDLPSGGAASVVNGVIVDYIASTGSIGANNFVEFVNQGDNLSTTPNYPARTIKAVALSETIVVVLHTGGASSASGQYLHAAVCSISGSTIRVTSDTQVFGSPSGYNGIAACALSDTKLFVATGASTNSSSMSGAVITVTDQTVSVGGKTDISTISYSGSYPSAARLSSTKVIVSHGSGASPTGASSRPYAVVCTIEGSTITVGTDIQVANSTYGGYTKVVALSESKAVVLYNYGSGSTQRTYGAVCSISGRDIILTPGVALTSLNYSGFSEEGRTVSAVAITESRLVLFYNALYSDTSTGSYLHASTVDVDGTTLTPGQAVKLTTTPYSGGAVSATVLGSSQVCAIHNGLNSTSSDYTILYGLMCQISNDTIIAGTDIPLCGPSSGVGTLPDIVTIPNSRKCAFFTLAGLRSNSNSKIRAGIISPLTPMQLRRVSKSGLMIGLTTTPATTSTSGQAYIFDTRP